MKNAGRIIMLISGVLVGLLGLAFLVIEMRLLCSGDFLIYSSPSAGLWNIITKIIVSLFLTSFGIWPFFFFTKKEHPALRVYGLVFGVGGIFIAGIAKTLFNGINTSLTFYLCLAIRILLSLYVLGCTFYVIYLYLNSQKKQSQPK